MNVMDFEYINDFSKISRLSLPNRMPVRSLNIFQTKLRKVSCVEANKLLTQEKLIELFRLDRCSEYAWLWCM